MAPKRGDRTDERRRQQSLDLAVIRQGALKYVRLTVARLWHAGQQSVGPEQAQSVKGSPVRSRTSDNFSRAGCPTSDAPN